MDSERLIIPGLGTLRRQVIRYPSAEAESGEGVLVSWMGNLRLPGGGRAALDVREGDVPFSQEDQRGLAEAITGFLAGEGGFMREVAADLLDLVNSARALRDPPAPPLTLDTLLPRLTLTDVSWQGGKFAAVYRVDEPEFTRRDVTAQDTGGGRPEVRTTLLEVRPPSPERLAEVQERLRARVEAMRAALEPLPPPVPAEEETGEAAEVPGLGTLRRKVRRLWAALAGESPSELVLVSWEAGVRLPNGEEAKVAVGERGPLTPEQVRRAGERIAAFLAFEPEARRRIAADLLDLANDWWDSREEGEDPGPLTLETFLAKLRLESVSLEEGGDLTASYDDAGEVFAGHAVQGVFGEDLNLTSTDIPG